MENMKTKDKKETKSKKLSMEMKEKLNGHRHFERVKALIELVSDFYIENYPADREAGKAVRKLSFEEFCESVKEKINI